MVNAYLGLGSNIGDRETQLEEAIRILDNKEGIQVAQTSPIYETDPVGYTDQPQFLNQCIEVQTVLPPSDLLKACLDTEQQLHRVRDIRWGPRTLDVDILIYGNLTVEQDDLIIPHPRMLERAFVLIPLNDIASDVIEPQSHKKISQLVKTDDTVKQYQSDV
ncbi:MULTISPECIES: 2-amino-4-hydroxy-6-hydroxymethyldihydropteridine diphosphokinase [Staphylococcus]|uniref:2-amino-4-hydroxy-6-hydroxymethyldihydropteridine diphosphokinase n=1 Tax=Staphylococcus hsinchuensis TaxID=3051183 RepID=A0ABZ3EEL2_9STAP|nr:MULTISPECIES: 2-amino-4-hydroxy-6-hydroxymethyldihydropteridine diphosphokinase [unclassified Staphylococcus]